MACLSSLVLDARSRVMRNVNQSVTAKEHHRITTAPPTQKRISAMEKSTKKGLFSPEVYQDCLNRIERLTPVATPQWGRMSAAQMLSHCAEILEVANGKELAHTPLLVKLFKGVIRKMVVSEKPYPRNAKTHPQYRQRADCDFAAGKKRLLNALDKFYAAGKTGAGQPKHPLFGAMTPVESGWSMYKHLDHHLRQFNV